MTAPVAAVRLTADELSALRRGMGVTTIPGIHEEEAFEPLASEVSPAAGARSLVARGLADVDDGEDLAPGEVVRLLVGALAAADRRLIVVDPSLDGAVATVSLSGSTLVLHRRVAPGVHDLFVTTREDTEALLSTLLTAYEPRPDAPDEPDDDEHGTLASLTVYSTADDPPWLERWDVWLAETSGAVLLIDSAAGTTEAVSGLPALVTTRLLHG